MHRPLLAALLLAGPPVRPADVPAPPTAEQARHFEARIRPALLEHCAGCHGAKKQMGGLRLDTRDGLLRGGDTGPAVVPGDPAASLLIRAVRHDGPRMPPKKQLAAADVELLARWVRDGAPWPAAGPASRARDTVTDEDRQFWAFRPPADHPVPAVRDAAWARTPVDHFLLAHLEAAGVRPAPDADRRTLLRRVTFDLTGLPPAPDEVEAFAADPSPDALPRLVDRLLASPAYGERWGRHWLDVARYADTAGDNSDYPVPQLYRYRDWVLRAFARDLPFDEFVRHQLAGDLVPGGSPAEARDRLVATGYLAGARRFGSYEDKRYPWYLTFEDSIENLGRAFLGLSLSCARCHDHKFDPIPSEDYYALYGFFQSTRYPWAGTELDKRQHDLAPLGPDSASRLGQLADIDARIHAVDRKSPEAARLRRQRDDLARRLPPVELAYAVGEGRRWVGDAAVQLRGDPARPGKVVPRRFLQVLGGQALPAGTAGSGRLELARWLADPANPLTARVLVNRVWMHHFGRGIVPTPNDFGRQGQPPSHPELLDWLARDFVAGGWSVKRLHRLLVLSHAYQVGDGGADGDRARDPANALFGRFPARRLDAEAVRDTLLDLAGVLDRSPGGPHPFPAESAWDFTQHNPFKAVYDTDRRSVYLMTQRIQRHPYLALFDGPDTGASTGARGTSTTPLQALYLMNDPLAHRLARAFADRLLREAGDEAGRIDRSFRLAFARPPAPEERAAAAEFLARARERLARAGLRGPAADRAAWEGYARAVFLSNELVHVH